MANGLTFFQQSEPEMATRTFKKMYYWFCKETKHGVILSMLEKKIHVTLMIEEFPLRAHEVSHNTARLFPTGRHHAQVCKYSFMHLYHNCSYLQV